MYSKYHGCGNDFIVGMYDKNIDYAKFSQKVCNRNTGIGADGLLIAKVDENKEIEMMFYNADGSRAPMCGNGIRCFAYFCLREKLVDSNEFKINTLSGKMGIRVLSREPFVGEINLGKPNFSSKALGINTSKETFLNEVIMINGWKIKVDAVYMATHHLVVIVDNLKEVINSDLGEKLSKHKIFTKGINVNFVQIINTKEIIMKTYERGVGWTLACGTGAAASFVILNQKGLCDNKIEVKLELGKIKLSYNENKEILMEGPAVCIAHNIEID
ncbi:MAG TPA: diaminopimelate epimerase [Bacilli bacterium]|nr:diaminopimelate epimerase [Bacilli bacterium]